MDNFFESYSKVLDNVEPISLVGKIKKIKGLLFEFGSKMWNRGFMSD